MTNIIKEIENEQIAKLGKTIPDFKPGDTVRVHNQVVEGETKRIQVYEGVCVARKNAGLNSSFTVNDGLQRCINYLSLESRFILCHFTSKLERCSINCFASLSFLFNSVSIGSISEAI